MGVKTIVMNNVSKLGQYSLCLHIPQISYFLLLMVVGLLAAVAELPVYTETV